MKEKLQQKKSMKQIVHLYNFEDESVKRIQLKFWLE